MRRFMATMGAAAVLATVTMVQLGTASAAPSTYDVTIARDSWGVPHITAADWGSIGYGQGYALAADRSCTVIDQIVKVRGDRARWLGAGEDDEHVNSDFAYRHLGLWENAPTRWAEQSERVQDVVDGYVAGFNAQVADGGLGSWCSEAAWANANSSITTQDLYAYISDILLLASSRNLIREIGTAQPPAAADTAGAVDASTPVTEPATTGWRRLESPGASNGWALGADRSTTGGGLLLGNPHFPWEGELRFWESHLTIPGELDVYGVALGGLPGIQIGFNEAVAWTHTVSAGHRFTLYRYDLDPSDPTTYLVDGEPRSMTASEHTIDVLGDDGETTSLSRTLYASHHGPVVDVAPLGWTPEQAIAIRDGNIEITNVLEQYLGMDTATSMDEFQAVHAEYQGVPWVNTISTSADGRAWLADTSATPLLSADAITAWEAERDAGGLIGLAYDQAGIIMLDGSDSLFEWVDDPAAPAPGLVPYAQVPQLERFDYVFNANDSYWFQNPNQLLTGFSPLAGDEAVAQTPRTRTNAMLLGETTEPWAIDDVQAAIFSDRSILSDTLLPALVEACSETPTVELGTATVDLTAACDALAGWDGSYTLDARGAIVFREWLSRFTWADRADAGRLFADPFDPTDPGGTPSVPVEDRQEWLVELGSVVQLLGLLGIPVDAPLGDHQHEVRSGERIPIHGGMNSDGVANIVDCCSEATSTAEQPDNGERVNGQSALRMHADGSTGYSISRGASFVMTVQYGPDGPVAEGFLTYGNPDDPASPASSDGLRAFSAGEWRPLQLDGPESSSGVEITELSAPRE